MKYLKKLQKIPVVGHFVNKAISTLASKDADVISKHFSQYLKSNIALTEPLKHEVFKLRHQVYCEELHFEDIKDSQEERDNFDEHSLHCFIRHVKSEQMAGTVRLITSENTEQLLPIEKYCSHAITDPELNPALFPRHDICEISRLAVPAAFRRRKFDQFSGAATGVINEVFFSETELRCFPYIAICLYLSAAVMAMRSGKKHVYVMMEPRLARSMSFVGIVFKPLGEPVEYHGRRAAYYISHDMFFKHLSPGYRKLLASIELELFGTSDNSSGKKKLSWNPLIGIKAAIR